MRKAFSLQDRVAAWGRGWCNLIAAVFLTLTGCDHSPAVVIHTPQGDVRVTVEIADFPESRTHGLMYRTNLADDAGMIFLFPRETEQSFWMKNTPLPLDMIFIGSSKQIVGIVNDAKPFSTDPRSVGRPSRYVLEVHGGFAAKRGLAAGQSVDFLDVPPDPQN